MRPPPTTNRFVDVDGSSVDEASFVAGAGTTNVVQPRQQQHHQSPKQQHQSSLEVYGFAIWILSFVGLGLYLLWACLPESLLHHVGWTYYPSQYWAVALPAYLVFMIPLVLLGYVGYNLRHTNPLDDIHTVADMYSRPLTRPVSRLELLDARMPEIADIPIPVVNRILYGSAASDPDWSGSGSG